MNLIKRRVFITLGIIALIVVLGAPTVTYAAIDDTAGNQIGTEGELTIVCDEDYVWFGDYLTGQEVNIGKDALLAGRDIKFYSGVIGGSVRAAGETISLSNIKIGSNITVAGRSINLGEKVSANGVYLAGQNVTFEGSCNCLYITGENVTINGKINGDLKIDAKSLVVGDDTEVTGSFTGDFSEEPEISDDAKFYGTMDMTVTTKEAKDIEESESFLDYLNIPSKIFSIGASLLMGVFMCLVLRRMLDSAIRRGKKNPVALPITGLISIIAYPIACLVFMITIVGIPLSLIFLVLYVLIIVIAVPFTGAFIGPMVFPSWNKWGSSMLGVLILAIASVLPYVGGLFKIAAICYCLGYFVLLAYYQLRKEEI